MLVGVYGTNKKEVKDMPSCHNCGSRMEYTGDGSNHPLTAELKCTRCGYRFDKCL